MTAINIGHYSTTPYGLFPYADPLALDQLGIEIYQIGKRTQALGIEVNHKIYDTGLFRVLWEIGSDGITADNFTSSPEASVDKAVINIKSDIIEQYWQSAPMIPPPPYNISEWVQWDSGSNKTIYVDTLALIGTNLSSSAIITLKGYGSGADVAPGSWAAIPVIATIKPSPIDPLERNILYVAQTQPATAYRHYRVEITDTNNDGFIRIGRLVAGQAMLFIGENCYDEIEFKNANYKDEFSINGFTAIANNRALKKTMTIRFKDLNIISALNYKLLKAYTTYCRDTLKALVIVDPQHPYQFFVFSKLKEMPTESHKYISSDTSTAALVLNYDEGR